MSNQILFEDAYIERCNKETEELIAKEPDSFLNQPLEHLKKHKNEFLYLESKHFEGIHVDAVSLEVDDVFGTYDVMLGLKLQKKFGSALKEELNQTLSGNEARFDLLFSNEDGLWDLNFALNYVEGFKEEFSIREAFVLIYQFLAKLVERVK
ncbi:branched-chain amino acid aminotransferase [Bacillus sp. MUM 116]|uniref:branched-chain amino acid aminotransferase n=1 Tax=Bacillus sp. MUM 116 TaxID=1678002 RepID=UPI0008F59686|nr:branched-chain amino acid aminotransferase [Bacillus sp. MUM 116]OIK15965.1 branched-chain amino acid aminotransferase [Bacillus sp. MUM 116]